jgi:propanol-preferring alcohol dehydrogenase
MRNSAVIRRTAALRNTCWPNYVAHVPPGLSSIEAAPLICAGLTAFKGIKQTEGKPGNELQFSGVGGFGHLAIQYAKAMGLLVCAVDIDDGQLAHAKCLAPIWSSMPRPVILLAR